jgi:hypothetical protein
MAKLPAKRFGRGKDDNLRLMRKHRIGLLSPGNGQGREIKQAHNTPLPVLLQGNGCDCERGRPAGAQL